ncbi:MAG: DUF4157 domain-containing protein [Lewinellaceae bacterium]|nr:DUF4157 domain-containing protein [Lewinellaceae bacterium]
MAKDFFSPAKTVSRTNENSEPFFLKGKKEESFFKAAADSENAFFKPSGLTPPQFNVTANPVQKKQQKEGNLPDEIQMKMENSFGTDFSNVNIQKDSKNATEIGALAYTQGNNIHFAPGQFKPNTQEGQELIGHELAHVVQQNQGRVVPTTQAKGMPLNDDISLENEADEMGKKAAQNKLGQAKFDKNVSELNKKNNYAPLQIKDEIIQKDGGATTAVAALAYQITSEVLSSAGGGSDIDLTVDEMTGIFYSRNATARSGGAGTNITTQKIPCFFLFIGICFI